MAFGATVTHRVNTASTSNAASYASGSFTPGAGEELVVFVTATGTTDSAPTLTDSQSLGWTLAGSWLTSAGNTAWVWVSNSAAAASAMTVTFGCPNDAATGAVIEVAGISGVNRRGTDAIKQFKTAGSQTSGTTPAVTFDTAANTGNVTIGFVGNSTNPATLTAPTNWTEANDTGYSTPTTGAEYVSRNSGFTGTTITWGGTSGSAYGAAIIEIDTSPAAYSFNPPTSVMALADMTAVSSDADTVISPTAGATISTFQPSCSPCTFFFSPPISVDTSATAVGLATKWTLQPSISAPLTLKLGTAQGLTLNVDSSATDVSYFHKTNPNDLNPALSVQALGHVALQGQLGSSAVSIGASVTPTNNVTWTLPATVTPTATIIAFDQKIAVQVGTSAAPQFTTKWTIPTNPTLTATVSQVQSTASPAAASAATLSSTLNTGWAPAASVTAAATITTFTPSAGGQQMPASMAVVTRADLSAQFKVGNLSATLNAPVNAANGVAKTIQQSVLPDAQIINFTKGSGSNWQLFPNASIISRMDLTATASNFGTSSIFLPDLQIQTFAGSGANNYQFNPNASAGLIMSVDYDTLGRATGDNVTSSASIQNLQTTWTIPLPVVADVGVTGFVPNVKTNYPLNPDMQVTVGMQSKLATVLSPQDANVSYTVSGSIDTQNSTAPETVNVGFNIITFAKTGANFPIDATMDTLATAAAVFGVAPNILANVLSDAQPQFGTSQSPVADSAVGMTASFYVPFFHPEANVTADVSVTNFSGPGDHQLLPSLAVVPDQQTNFGVETTQTAAVTPDAQTNVGPGSQAAAGASTSATASFTAGLNMATDAQPAVLMAANFQVDYHLYPSIDLSVPMGAVFPTARRIMLVVTTN